MGKIADFGHKQGKVFGKRATHPYPISLGLPPPRTKSGITFKSPSLRDHLLKEKRNKYLQIYSMGPMHYRHTGVLASQGRVLYAVSFSFRLIPCIRLARGKFELTNQDSAGVKNSCVLTTSWNQGTFVTENGIKYPRKITKRDLQFQKTKLVGKKWKIWTILCF